jgi:hypothetical protein
MCEAVQDVAEHSLLRDAGIGQHVGDALLAALKKKLKTAVV